MVRIANIIVLVGIIEWFCSKKVDLSQSQDQRKLNATLKSFFFHNGYTKIIL